MGYLSKPAALVLVSAGFALAIAQELTVRASGDALRISAPNFHFLTGTPMERIRGGTAIAFDFQLSLLGENRTTVLRRSFERFVISYDLWEERFSVTRMRSAQASASRLSAEGAEAWCMENLSVALNGLDQNRDVVVRLDVRAQLEKQPPPLLVDGTFSLPALVDIFSRAGNSPAKNSWRLETGPMRLASLRTPGKGSQ